MKNISIYTIFFFTFFGNTLVDYHFIPAYAVIIVEATIYALFIFSSAFYNRSNSNLYFNLWFLYGFFLLIAIFSTIVNRYYNIQPISSLRLFLRFYFFYLALINLELDDIELKKINKLIFFLFIIQLPVVAFKFYRLGISENTIGTYATHGGAITPLIPIIAIGYLSGFYYFLKKRMLYIILAIGFIFLGIAGNKRVLLFVYPVAFLGIYYLTNIVGSKGNLGKRLATMICILLISVSTSFLIIKYLKGYNYNESESNRISHAMKYAKDYTTSKRGEVATGRISTLQLAIKTVSDFEHFVFGFGPGALTKSILRSGYEENTELIHLQRSYGKTGLVTLLVEYGIIGTLVFFFISYSFARKCWNWFKSEADPYWKAFSMGSFIFSSYVILIFFFYNTEPFLGDFIPPLFYYAMAVTFLRSNSTEKRQNSFSV